MSSNGEEMSEPVVFKRKSRKNLQERQRQTDEEGIVDNDHAELTEKVEMYKELRKLRQRPHGVSTVTLALGKKATTEEDMSGMDPFKVHTGGMVDMAALNSGRLQMDSDDAYDTGIGTQFSAETNTRDEDAEMVKYIEKQLTERKRAESSTTESETPISRFMSPEEAALMSVPEYLRQSASIKSEEMLSNQMLSGIPEVDLGIEVKIKNIEATEEAKQKILRDRLKKNEGPSVFVPTNMAVNFVQHNRFNIEQPSVIGLAGQKRPAPKPEVVQPIAKPKKVVVVGSEPADVSDLQVLGPDGKTVEQPKGKDKLGEKATDDFFFEKFKKQFRRY